MTSPGWRVCSRLPWPNPTIQTRSRPSDRAPSIPMVPSSTSMSGAIRRRRRSFSRMACSTIAGGSICSHRISQLAALSALNCERSHLAEFEVILNRRRSLICARLDRVPHVFQYVRPEGAYYVCPRIVTEHRDSIDFSLRLLDEARVTVTPCSAFGPSGEHHVRMAYCDEDDVIRACQVQVKHVCDECFS